MREIDASGAKEVFETLLNAVEAGEEVVITRRDTPVARLMSANTPRDGEDRDLAEVEVRLREAAAAYDKLHADPSKTLTLDQVRAFLGTHHASAAFASNISRVLQAAMDLGTEPRTALHYIVDSPLRPFDGRTAMDLIEAGRADDVVDYLRSLSAGWTG